MNEAFVQFADAWGTSLWRASLQGGVAIAVAWVVFRRFTFLSPRVMCWIWRLACLKLLLGLFWVQPLELALLPAKATAPATATVSRNSAQTDFDPPSVDPKHLAQSRPEPAPSQNHLAASSVLFPLWLIGVVYCAFRTARQQYAARQLLRLKTPGPTDNLLRIFHEEGRRLGVRRMPRLQLSSQLESPILVGVWRPTIILPSGCESAFDETELRIMLAHELAHLRRRDLAWNWLPTVARWLFFFHPLVWLMARLWPEAQEAACDEVLLRRRVTQPSDYGRLLLKLAALSPLETRPDLTAVGVLGPYQTLERRIVTMTLVKPFSAQRFSVAAISIALVGVLSLVPWRLSAQEPKSQDTNNQTPAGGAKALNKVATVQYTETTKVKLKDKADVLETKRRVMILGSHQKREEGVVSDATSLGFVVRRYVTIYDTGKGTQITLYPDQGEFQNSTSTGFRGMKVDFDNLFRNVPMTAGKKLPERKVDGKTVIGFSLDESAYVPAASGSVIRTYWVDSQTKLPVQIELSTKSKGPNGSEVETVMSNIVFDAPLDASLFSTVPPKDYNDRVGKKAATRPQ